MSNANISSSDSRTDTKARRKTTTTTTEQSDIVSKNVNRFVDLKNNGRLFPTWVLHNFKRYKLPEIIRKDDEDPCSATVKVELRKYQEFVGQYLGPGSPYSEILLYHGLGSGKSANVINMLNIMYNYDHGTNFILLIKASLRDDPWMLELKKWLGRDPSEPTGDNVTKLQRYQNIRFVHYDSPFADREFLNVMKSIDTSKPIMFVIDEVHNFIRNVYSNISSKVGRRAQVIYEYILREKKENKDTKIILISATPGINTPYELALMFNLLRPGIFPSSETEFNRTFLTESTYPILNPAKRNMFERRILGLVSYYVGATPDFYASQKLKNINLVMSDYQYSVYRVFEKIENEIEKKARRFGGGSQLYHTYTRQASNFVFPNININVNGELRPRPGKFKISEKQADALSKGKTESQKELIKKSPDTDATPENRDGVKKYIEALELFVNTTEKYFKNIKEADEKTGVTITKNLEEFKAGFYKEFEEKFDRYYTSDKYKKSALLTAMYECSPKITAIVFATYCSPGKVMIYSNYVLMEGIDMIKVYLRLIGYNDYKIAQPGKGFGEYHGRISKEDRIKVKQIFNDNNIRGERCMIIILSPSATEGIQLHEIRQEHILEPYWTEVRIHQVIGRGIRQCSHKNLPMAERVVTVYRYKVLKPDDKDADDTEPTTADEYVEMQAKAKDNLIQSFLTALKEAAVDCELFKPHNMIAQTYTCFKFPEDALTGKNIGPAYKEDIKDDAKYDLGLHAKNSKVERIRVIKIQAVYMLTPEDDPKPQYSSPDKYWYHAKTGMVYDYETHYPVGRVNIVNDIPNKLDKDTYIMSDIILIPSIEPTKNL